MVSDAFSNEHMKNPKTRDSLPKNTNFHLILSNKITPYLNQQDHNKVKLR